MNTRFFFVRDVRSWFPVGCVAYKVEPAPKKNRYTISYQFSTWNPKDKWDRKIARQLAEERLNDNPYKFIVERGFQVSENLSDVSRIIISEMVSSKDMPARLYKHVRRMDDYFWITGK